MTMKELLISLIETIIGWTFIIFIIIKVINYFKQRRTKEQIKNLKLQENNKDKEKEERIRKYCNNNEELIKNFYKEKNIKQEELNKNYKINNNIFTETEKNFYKILKLITDELNLNILSKVRLADIIYTKNKNYKYFNKIKAKHIDFVLIDKEGNIKLLIELDDKTHNNYDRKQRDKFINEIFENEKTKLLRINAQYTYNLQEIKQKIQESL